jgi:hypothetical protein
MRKNMKERKGKGKEKLMKGWGLRLGGKTFYRTISADDSHRDGKMNVGSVQLGT